MPKYKERNPVAKKSEKTNFKNKSILKRFDQIREENKLILKKAKVDLSELDKPIEI